MRLVTALLLLFAAVPAVAQRTDFEGDRVPMVNLEGPWRFHTGDNPAWADRSVDDSSWSLLSAGKPWAEQGYHGYAGVAWYRLAVTLPEHPGSLAIYIPQVQESYQVFANGRLIGQSGGLPPHARFEYEFLRLFPIPADAIVAGKPLEIALRVWHWPGARRGSYGGLVMPPVIGDREMLSDQRDLSIRQNFWYNAENVLDLYANTLTAMAGICLFLLWRSERGYLLWGLSQLCWAGFVAVQLHFTFFRSPRFEYLVAGLVLYVLAQFLQNEFYVLYLRQRRGWLFWGAAFCILMDAAAQIWAVFWPRSAPPSLINGTAQALQHLCVVGILWIGVRKRHPGALLLLVPTGLMLTVQVADAILNSPVLAAKHWAMQVDSFLIRPSSWPFPLDGSSMIGMFQMFAVLFILVRNYARSHRDEQRLEAELQAARAVQSVLIPTDVPAIPGFRVETAYKPASQVGGDFFQIIPLERGGALIAVGDVSGKGMPAAMTVSLLVGTFRTLAHYTQSPAEILRAMNVRMISRSNGGFTTCLVLRLDADGTLTLANAGHLAPYVGGHETTLENGLPLGLSADTDYAETTLHLDRDHSLTLLTDGVLEARSHSGELFGFERTSAISMQPAESIASAAQAFGQEDDITVLTLALAPAGVLA